VTLLNEIGLDPGIDHLSAMQLIDAAHADGGRVVSFESLCGGLPAPEAASNPLQYKFSWSPRGVLLAGLNASRHLRDGKVRVQPGRPPSLTPTHPDAVGMGRLWRRRAGTCLSMRRLCSWRLRSRWRGHSSACLTATRSCTRPCMA
jgi:hypothetical protein